MNLLLESMLALIVFAFAVYPLWLWCLARLRPQPWQTAPGTEPTVTVIIAAHNEAARIDARLDNLLAQDFPMEKLEILLVSDGSSDDTLQRARAWAMAHQAHIRMHVVDQQPCQGKPTAINRAMQQASGELVVFADARQYFEPDVISRLAENFTEPAVGACSGELMFRTGSSGEVTEAAGLYWRIEKGIRRHQALTGSVMGVTGAIYAMRRELFRPLPAGALVDDLATPLNVMAAGYRVVFDGRAKAWDEAPTEGRQEFRRKVRTLAGVWQCLPQGLSLVAAGRPGLMARFLAHKISRLLVPWAMLVLLIGCSLSEEMHWRVLAGLQWLGYGLVLLAWWQPALRRVPLVSTAYFFVLLNVAAGRALMMLLAGRQGSLWRRSGGDAA